MPNLAAAATTITVPPRASLFLVGTGAEAIAASFNVQGALSLMMLSVTGGSTKAISVAAGGSLTVSASQLVDSASEGGAQPFPCDGTLATGCVGAHAGAVVVSGPMGISTAAPLVCDAASGRCNTAHCPAGATQVAAGANISKYCSDLVGLCRGPGFHTGQSEASTMYVNAKFNNAVPTRAQCQAACDDAVLACVGYAYDASSGHCRVYGPGINHDLHGGWGASTIQHPTTTTTIGGASGSSNYVCAAVVGRN
jgi:hypothetical protein